MDAERAAEITRYWLGRFQEDLARSTESDVTPEIDPRLRQAIHDGLRSVILDLEEDLERLGYQRLDEAVRQLRVDEGSAEDRTSSALVASACEPRQDQDSRSTAESQEGKMSKHPLKHHQPTEAQLVLIAHIRSVYRTAFDWVQMNIPPSAARTTAMRKIQEAQFWTVYGVIMDGDDIDMRSTELHYD